MTGPTKEGDEADAVVPPRYQIEQALLLEVSQAITATLELAAVVQVIADGTARLLGVETTAVYLVVGDRLFLGATTPPLDPGIPENLRWARREEHPHIARALASQQAVVLPDTAQAPLSPAERAVVELRGLRSLLYVPFSHQGQPVGLLIVGTMNQQRSFGARDIDLCCTLANQLAVGVQNARLHAGVKAYAAELEHKIAEQKRLAEHLRLVQKMEAVGQLAGGIAHDFNNLLQVVLGYTEMARVEAGAGSEVDEMLELVLQATGRARHLVRQLLAFARRQVLSLQAVDVDRLIAGLLPMLRPLLGAQIAVTAIPAARPAIVRADPNQLEQALINLCINARDAMPNGGNLTLTTDHRECPNGRAGHVQLPSAGSYVRIAVTDTGAGMDADTCLRACEPFFTTKAPGHGTGLGLAMVHGLVAQHGGAVDIGSVVGEGTTVSIHLPVADAEPSVAVAAPGKATTSGSETILFAEDDPAVRAMTGALLTGAGYSVLPAQDGVEAVRLIAEHGADIDLALLDVVMPGLGGPQVFRALRAKHPGIPVVFASGYGNAPDPAITAASRVAMVPKPYTRDELLGKIRELLGSRDAP